ncbi:hypothetical protein B0I72DRAFT_134685 [Yarrowia lipolytica]|uniref:YALI0D02695p n=2 Tax=Yarrowia lipolytica TaxID=4952 RepID=Q6CAH6_YARLI|nr:YALI0D02695p [Yarrowia lipolytica CLIB122]AOW03494.1 hypothetical protein YALI1_D03329g [Yarrowia lipolytica]KAB8284726.1 hypothetical protein BKA91DRAFT_134782 [Yarrowia lipolytica]KAE8170626.1 hypothetical protein BKA90DRAFT_140476 [Yarrowia lipolytica]KAJ8054870.1 hypothetical protein LXG23DRAFT_56424 [Yarrowia lipolytica]RDW25892.1 hypothetical protein B0I71DRAFT_131848 [Yarrowia lipolytica]|eukprot:XP_502336.2 YALI0D02695p [Yarrowia lipolytica CLIB122]
MSDDVIARYEYLKNHPGHAEFKPFTFHGKPTSIRTLAGGFLIIVGLGFFIYGIIEKIQLAQDKAKLESKKETDLDVPKIETEEVPKIETQEVPKIVTEEVAPDTKVAAK